MNNYKVEIETTFKHEVFIEAENLEDAQEIACELEIEDLNIDDSILNDFSIVEVTEVKNEE